MITKPTLLIDEIKCRENIKNMFLKAQNHSLDFRPHFKTHQSLEIGRWFKELGVDKITVSSVTMAQYFAEEWNDITIAFPVNILEVDKINDLAQRITLNLLVESKESILFLTKNLNAEVNIFLKIDVGSKRTGIEPSNTDLIDKILELINDSQLINLKGFLCHAGHTYQCRSEEEVKKIEKDSLDIMNALKEKYIKQYPDLIISIGDTPGCSLADDFSGVDEIRPGNFVFYDLTQKLIGSNSISQIAVALACPIVAIHKNRSEIVVYGGGVHLSKERLEDKDGIIYGRVAEKKDKGWGDVIPGMYVKALSQEHGVIVVPKERIENFKVGEYLLVLPVHSCMTANLIEEYTLLNGGIITKL